MREIYPRLLITGGSSYLGQALVPVAVRAFDTVYTYFRHDTLGEPYGVHLDVRDETAVHTLIRTIRPHAIIHTAGSNRNPDMVNVIQQGTAHVAAAAQAVGARLIHLSTDSIFRGDRAPYDETAVGDPVNPYGAAKTAAEETVGAVENSVIVRTSLIYSPQRMDHGTVWMAAALARGEAVTLFDNQIRNPISAETLAAACVELAMGDYCGVLNVAGRQVLSRAEFAQKLLAWWAVPGREQVVVGAAPAGRWPLDCRLDLRRATAVLDTPLSGVDEVLAAEA
jgi:dTDP-4-dehydrorhamnose reductase